MAQVEENYFPGTWRLTDPEGGGAGTWVSWEPQEVVAENYEGVPADFPDDSHWALRTPARGSWGARFTTGTTWPELPPLSKISWSGWFYRQGEAPPAEQLVMNAYMNGGDPWNVPVEPSDATIVYLPSNEWLFVEGVLTVPEENSGGIWVDILLSGGGEELFPGWLYMTLFRAGPPGSVVGLTLLTGLSTGGRLRANSYFLSTRVLDGCDSGDTDTSLRGGPFFDAVGRGCSIGKNFKHQGGGLLRLGSEVVIGDYVTITGAHEIPSGTVIPDGAVIE